MNWWWTLGILVVLAVVTYFWYRKINQQRAEFDKMYRMGKQVKEIFYSAQKNCQTAHATRHEIP